MIFTKIDNKLIFEIDNLEDSCKVCGNNISNTAKMRSPINISDDFFLVINNDMIYKNSVYSDYIIEYINKKYFDTKCLCKDCERSIISKCRKSFKCFDKYMNNDQLFKKHCNNKHIAKIQNNQSRNEEYINVLVSEFLLNRLNKIIKDSNK